MCKEKKIHFLIFFCYSCQVVLVENDSLAILNRDDFKLDFKVNLEINFEKELKEEFRNTLKDKLKYPILMKLQILLTITNDDFETNFKWRLLNSNRY